MAGITDKLKPLYFVLSKDDGSRVFAVQTNGGCRVPLYVSGVAEHIGFEDPDPFLKWFEQSYSIPVFRRYIVESSFADTTVMVLEIAGVADDWQRFADAVWLPHGEAAGLYEQGTVLHRVLLGLPEHFSQSRIMPWVRARGFQPCLDPMIGKLRSLSHNPDGMEIRQIKNAYVSSVFRCRLDDIDYYLKLSSPVFIREIEN
ncbi:MAG: hypothetical protein K0R28_6373, partial [Paenibacillus sp.]|nr:hypothetical protein [Paenibacillus sp.]